MSNTQLKQQQPVDIAGQKAALRRQIRAWLAQHATQQRGPQGELALGHMIDLIHQRAPGEKTAMGSAAHTKITAVALFVSLGDEIDLSALHNWLAQRGIQRWVPQKDKHTLDIPKHCGLLLIPGLAFDRCGNRLGRGQGYYDRLLQFLSQRPHPPLTVGMCLRKQVLETVPVEPHDQTVDALCIPGEGITPVRKKRSLPSMRYLQNHKKTCPSVIQKVGEDSATPLTEKIRGG